MTGERTSADVYAEQIRLGVVLSTENLARFVEDQAAALTAAETERDKAKAALAGILNPKCAECGHDVHTPGYCVMLANDHNTATCQCGAEDDYEERVRQEYLTAARNAVSERDEARRERDDARAALRDLHAEVEMAESVGICLPDRVASLRAGDVLARVSEPEQEPAA